MGGHLWSGGVQLLMELLGENASFNVYAAPPKRTYQGIVRSSELCNVTGYRTFSIRKYVEILYHNRCSSA